MIKDLVSIVTPSYNSSKFIIETINSIISQTYTNWELLIVDDCSTDDTVEVVRTYISEHKENRIRVFVNEKNSGAAFSRNKALREARGKWVAFLDSDDLWMPHKLEEQLDFMKANDYHFSYTYYIQIGEDSKPNGKMLIGPKHVSKPMLNCFDWMGCLTVMYDAELVGPVQIPDTIMKRNDYALWLKVIEHADCYCYQKVCAKYRIRQGSISRVPITTLIRHHIIMFMSLYGCSHSKAMLYTVNNIIWGLLKKLFYIRHYSE